MEVVLSKTAYCKLFLHLAKYPHLQCNGLLLTRKQASTNNSRLEYVDCIPLFHSSLSLAPSLEIALVQIDSYCQANDLEISGYYQASDNNFNDKPNLITYKITEKLKDNSSHSLAFMIDNNKIHPSRREPCFTVYHFVDQKLKEFNCNVKLEEPTYKACEQLLKDKEYTNLYDFDSHLDDLKYDWRNSKLNEVISNVSCRVDTLRNKED